MLNNSTLLSCIQYFWSCLSPVENLSCPAFIISFTVLSPVLHTLTYCSTTSIFSPIRPASVQSYTLLQTIHLVQCILPVLQMFYAASPLSFNLRVRTCIFLHVRPPTYPVLHPACPAFDLSACILFCIRSVLHPSSTVLRTLPLP